MTWLLWLASAHTLLGMRCAHPDDLPGERPAGEVLASLVLEQPQDGVGVELLPRPERLGPEGRVLGEDALAPGTDDLALGVDEQARRSRPSE